MALDFGTESNDYYVNHGTLGDNGVNQGTVISWCFPESTFTDTRLIIGKYLSSTAVLQHNCTTTGNISVFYGRADWNSRLQAISSGTPINFDAWNFTAARWDRSGVDGDQDIFWGDLNTVVSEVGGYIVQQVGSGGSTATTGDATVGSVPTQSWSFFQGLIGLVGLWDIELTDAEIREQQYEIMRPVVQRSNCLLFCNLGFDGTTGTQTDWSGNRNNGTVTGATAANHVPIALAVSQSGLDQSVGFGVATLTGTGSLTGIITVYISGTTAWGHDTGVLETNTRNFSEWSGTGSVENSGDAERLALDSAENMVSEIVYTGAGIFRVDLNVYQSGDAVTVDYRTGATVAAVEAAGWSSYTVPFSSSGFVQIRVTSTL